MTANEKNIINFPKRKDRKIVIGETNWKYRIGKDTIKAYSEHGDAIKESCHNLVGVSPDTFSRGRWKETRDGMVTPELVAKWISSIKN